jgi:hypothetical protein
MSLTQYLWSRTLDQVDPGRSARYTAGQFQGFQHRNRRLRPAPDVEDGRFAGLAHEHGEGSGKVRCIEIVANLQAAIADELIGLAAGDLPAEIGEKTMGLDGALVNAGDAARPKHIGAKTEPQGVFLDHQVGGGL